MPYQAEARIVCRVFASSASVTIPDRSAPIAAHPAFHSMSISQRLFNVAPTAVDKVPDNSKAECLAKATDFVKRELPATYSVDVAGTPIPGHAFIDGRWVNTNPAYVSYAFPLRLNGEPIEDECVWTDPAGKEQSVTFSWSVVIQPQ